MLRYFSMPRDIGCELDSLSFLPPSSEQLLGVLSGAAEEEHGMGGSSYQFMRSLYSVSVSPVPRSHSFSQTRSINNSSLMVSPLIMGSLLINSSSQMVSPSPDDDHSSPYFLGVEFDSMRSLSQNAAMCSMASFVLASLDSSVSLDSSLLTYSCR